MMARSMRRRSGPFIATKEHRRFTEFANTIRKHGTIGLCFGPAGVGKTLSARRHANWEIAEPYPITGYLPMPYFVCRRYVSYPFLSIF